MVKFLKENSFERWFKKETGDKPNISIVIIVQRLASRWLGSLRALVFWPSPTMYTTSCTTRKALRLPGWTLSPGQWPWAESSAPSRARKAWSRPCPPSRGLRRRGEGARHLQRHLLQVSVPWNPSRVAWSTRRNNFESERKVSDPSWFVQIKFNSFRLGYVEFRARNSSRRNV